MTPSLSVAPRWPGAKLEIQVQHPDGETTTHWIREIARGTGLDPTTVSKIFLGRRNGRIGTLRVIAAYLGVSETLLLDALDRSRA